MTSITLTRINYAPTYTLGFIKHGDFFCFTLEPARVIPVLKWEDQSGNGRHLTANDEKSAPTKPGCIQCGVYPIVWEYSPKFDCKLWELKDVPGRSEIKVHMGNLEEDTNGCILVGEHWRLNQLEYSRPALIAFNALCHDQKITEIEVREL